MAVNHDREDRVERAWTEDRERCLSPQRSRTDRREAVAAQRTTGAGISGRQRSLSTVLYTRRYEQTRWSSAGRCRVAFGMSLREASG